MIRFVLIGDQVEDGENQFCFFNTQNQKFVNFESEVLFDSREDFSFFSSSKAYKRCEALIPSTYIDLRAAKVVDLKEVP